MSNNLLKKNQALVLFLFLMLPFSLFSFDFGIGINNKTVLHADPGRAKTISAEEKLLLSLQMSHFFNDYYYVYVRSHAEVGMEFDHSQNLYQFYPSGDIDRFIIGGKLLPKNETLKYVNFQVGRQFFSDFSKNVAYLLIDGASVDLGFDGAELSMTAGYTGFVYRWTNPIKMSAADVYQTQQWTGHLPDPTTEQAVQWDRYASMHASPRLIANLELKVPSLIRGQNLYFDFLAQADLWSCFSSKMASKGSTDNLQYSPIHTFYTGAGLNGFINQYLSYNVFSYFGTGLIYRYQPDPENAGLYSFHPKTITSGMVGLDLEAFIKEALFSHLVLNFRYASGQKGSTRYYDLDGDEPYYTRFVPLNNKRDNVVFNPILSNLITIGLNYSFKPFSSFDDEYAKTILIELDLKTFLRASQSPISFQNQMNDNNADWYIGTELDFLVNLLSLSDFNLFTSMGLFIPNQNVFKVGNEKPRFEAELNFSFSF